MKQLSRRAAASLGKSGAWETWTNEQIVSVQLFQDRHCVGLPEFFAALSEILNRPVLRHEFAFNKEGLRNEFLQKAPAPNAEEIFNLIPKRRKLLVWL